MIRERANGIASGPWGYGVVSWIHLNSLRPGQQQTGFGQRGAGGGFAIGEVSADKAYCGLANFEAVAGCGGEFFPAFKSNATGGIGGHFEKAFHYFSFKQEEYLAHYHKRSNVESTFSMVKRKFGADVRSKTDVAMANEVLCKFIAHNLCVLIHEEQELGIEPLFWKGPTTTAIACNELKSPATEFIGNG